MKVAFAFTLGLVLLALCRLLLPPCECRLLMDGDDNPSADETSSKLLSLAQEPAPLIPRTPPNGAGSTLSRGAA